MVTCSVCGKKVSFWTATNQDDKFYCDNCWRDVEKKNQLNKEKELREELKIQEKKKKKELTFILQRNEKIVSEAERVQYSGPTIVTFGTGTVLGSGLSRNFGTGTGIFSSKQIKREGSIWDAKPAHVYVTNKRIVFCNAKIGLFGGAEQSIGTPFSEVHYRNIKGISSSFKFANPAIDISVLGRDGIDNIKFWFLGGEANRSEEREKILKLIKRKV